MKNEYILAGDIGATNSRLALFETQNTSSPVLKAQAKYPSQEFSSLEDIAEQFLESQNTEIVSACFGVPGPVVNGSVQTTNLPWKISEDALEQRLSCTRVLLKNDLASIASSIPLLGENDKELIYPGEEPREKNIFCVIAPGTGLGQAAVQVLDDELIPLASEGGHIDFAPRNKDEFELLEFLFKRFSRVSVERIASGSGLRNIFDFLVECKSYKVSEELKDALEKDDFGYAIGTRAVKGSDELCVKTIELFIDALASHAGSMALTYLCTGGIYLAGGIAPQLRKFICSDRFFEHYTRKGRLSPVAARTPIYLITDTDAGIRGSAELARRSLCKIRAARRMQIF